MESKGVHKGNSMLIVGIGVFLLSIAGGILIYSGSIYSIIPPSATSAASLILSVKPTVTATPIPSSPLIATTNSRHTVTYSELSRNETMTVIQFKLEPNSYIFQLNASAVNLTQGSATIATNTNKVVIIGTQYSTVFFPVKGYNGTDYLLSSCELPSDAVWIRQ